MGAINRTERACPVLRISAWQLTALLLFVVASALHAPAKVRAEDYVATQGYIHAFNNNVTVYTGVFALNKEFSLDTSVYGKYTVDVIGSGLFEGLFEDDDHGGSNAVSGASSAAGGGGKDIRHEVTGGITHNFPGLFGAELYYDYSTEKDYLSSTPSVTLKKELFGKNTTLAFGYSRNMDDISGKYLPSTMERTTNNYYFGLTQVLSPYTIAQAGYSLMRSSGNLTEGIRLVPVDGEKASNCTDLSATCMAEAFPDSRERKAYIVGLNHYFTGGRSLGAGSSDSLAGDSSIRLTFRYYTDDWDIKSYTGEVEHNKYITAREIVRLNYRFYTQTSSYFFKDSYLSTDALRSSSPQHREYNSHLAGIKFTHLLTDTPTPGAMELGTLEGKYEFYYESSGTWAHILMASLRFLF